MARSILLLLVYTAAAGAADPPPLRREFRGVWVASVANIDWPSRKGLDGDQQKAELLAILDKAVEIKLNAIVLQIRPMCDALYASKLEPWSEYLTGTLGKDPGYDPLEFAVREAHQRGLELHAWFNPYRAHHPSSISPIPADHLVKKRPDLAKPYGKHHWLNPTHPEVAAHTLAVILDVVRRYDVDGIHLDDYFFPYTEKDATGKAIPFPDDDTWSAYVKEGGRRSISDWRRHAVDRFVENLYRDVKKAKPWVKVGISPFGIWRPGHPTGIQGFDQYEGLFADAKKWLNEGWVDYFTPQLYWPIKQEKQSYPRLLAWWANENTKSRHLWPGNIPSRVTGLEKGWPAQEIGDQVLATRAQMGATGNVHFSMKPLMKNTGGVTDVLARVYSEPALAPASPWLGREKPPAPNATRSADRGAVIVQPTGETVRFLAIRWREGERWSTRVCAAHASKQTMILVPGNSVDIRVMAVDRIGNESAATKVLD